MFGPDLRAALDAELGRGFDVLHLEQLWSGWLGLEHVDRALVNVHYLVGDRPRRSRPNSYPTERLDRALAVATERRLIKKFRFFRGGLAAARRGDPADQPPRPTSAPCRSGSTHRSTRYIPDERRNADHRRSR